MEMEDWQLGLLMKLMTLTSALDVLYLDPGQARGVCNDGSNSVSTIVHPAAESFQGPEYV
jgi:hypothetical protein